MAKIINEETQATTVPCLMLDCIVVVIIINKNKNLYWLALLSVSIITVKNIMTNTKVSAIWT
jgi:hypothetical protein